MKLAVIGFGNAGSKIADRLLGYEEAADLRLTRSVMAINTARIDLAKPDNIPQNRRYLIGQTDDRVKGHGVGSDPDLGAEITRADQQELERALDDVPIFDIDAFLIIAGLGGGTGSGGAPVLANRLRELYTEPVYGLAVLPSEAEGGRAALNAARSFPTFVNATDNLLLFDNDLWHEGGDTIEAGYERTNHEIAKRIGTLLAPGEFDGTTVSENAMDSSDIRRTLATGGVSTIAYAEAGIETATARDRGLLSRFRRDDRHPIEDTDVANKIIGLVRQAVRSRLTCEADIESVERSLLVVSGPSAELSRKGLENSRRWLEEQTGSGDVFAGDDPRENVDRLAAVILLSNVTTVPRIDELQEQGVLAQRDFEAQHDQRERNLEDLITDDHNELDPV